MAGGKRSKRAHKRKSERLPSSWQDWFPYCWYCKRKLDKDTRTTEHIPPLWIARMGNLETARVPCCEPCNLAADRWVTSLFPPYFLALWQGYGLPRERKMLPCGNESARGYVTDSVSRNERKHMQYERISPPERGEIDDPRDVLWVCVDDLAIDPAVQRGLQRSSPVWKTEWSWPKVETVTVADRDGKLYVVEGQNRVEKRKLIAPGSFMWAVLLPGSGREHEAATALGISRGRRPHSAYDIWKLAAESGGAHELAAEAVLHDFGLSLTNSAKSTRAGIASIASVSLIMKKGERTPEQGAALLEQVLKVITGAFLPEDTDRFEPAMLRGIADIFETSAKLGRKVNTERLIREARKHDPRKWLSMAKDAAGTYNETSNVWLYVARELLRYYNKGLQKDGPNKLKWSRDVKEEM